MNFERANEEWLSRLRGDSRAAVEELQKIITVAITSFDLSVEDREDCVQASIELILARSESFQHKSKFTSWAVAIAVNTALNLLRKKRWETISLDQIDEAVLSKDDGLDTRFECNKLLVEVEQMIEFELTPKQRMALLAELGSMPLTEIARKMKTSRGAIYKLTHDARKKLLSKMKDKGININDVLQSVE